MAAKSLKQFLSFAKKIRSINKKVVPGYWPIIEGTYWISPFTSETELNRLGREFLDEKLKSAFRYFVKKQHCPVGLGVIAKGILGDEKIITEKDLLYDLKYFKDTKEIFIFRLGGLTRGLAVKIGA